MAGWRWGLERGEGHRIPGGGGGGGGGRAPPPPPPARRSRLSGRLRRFPPSRRRPYDILMRTPAQKSLPAASKGAREGLSARCDT